jgi:surfeit locus 1 family protein
MQFRFSWKITVVGLVLAGIFLRLSYWQWERHEWKLGLIENLRSRVEQPVVPLESIPGFPALSWEDLEYRRVQVSGSYDFSKEVLLRNRKFGKAMGVHVLTPLRLSGSQHTILVNRGFLPQTKADPEVRRQYQKPERITLTGLVKASSPRKFMAPPDPTSGEGHPWVDRWLRVDIPNIEKQLPYPLLPVFLEIVETPDVKAVEQSIVDQSGSGRDDMLFLQGTQELGSLSEEEVGDGRYPIPVFDTVVPPGRHFGYIFEWAIMALMTIAICVVLQLRRPGSITSRKHPSPQSA